MPVYEVEVSGKTFEIDAPTPPTREQAQQYVARMTPSSTPSLAENIGARPPGGYTVSDAAPKERPVMDALSTAAHPQDLGDFLGLLIPNAALTTIAGKGPISAGAKFFARAATRAHETYKETKSLKGVPADYLRELYRGAFSKEPDLVRLVKNPTSEFELAFKETQKIDAPTVAGTSSKKASATGVNVNPATVSTRSGPMTATLPDKHGMTSIFPEGSPQITAAPNSAWSGNPTITVDQIITRAKELDAGAKGALSGEQVALAQSAVAGRVLTPVNAARLVSQNNPAKFTALMKILLKK